MAWSQSTGDAARLVRDRSAIEDWIAGADGASQRLRDPVSAVAVLPDLLSNMAQVLAKTDLGWPLAMPNWSKMPRCGGGCVRQIAAEHQRSINAHKLITARTIARPTTRRWPVGVQPFPVLGALNHLQVELLRRYRSGDDEELVQRGILLTMNGFGQRAAQQRLVHVAEAMS